MEDLTGNIKRRIFLWMIATISSVTLPSALHAQKKYPYQDPTLAVESRADDLVSRMTLQEKVSQMTDGAAAIPRLGIPAYDWQTEALHGVARAPATVFPQAIGMAATWDASLVHGIADTISTEARARYNGAVSENMRVKSYGLTIWSPNINIFRDPRWGRGQETYGEDPYLTSRLAVAFVRGLQGSDAKYMKTIATPKHFVAHSGPEPERHQFDSDPSAHDLEDTYLPAFRAAIVGGHAGSLMCSYNDLHGVPSCASHLLQDVVRGKYGFDGFITSDCGAIDDFYSPTGHHYSPNAQHAAASAVLAGTDLECGTSYKALPLAVTEGLLPERVIDTAVKRLMMARFRLGMFDPAEDVPYNNIPFSEMRSAAHQEQALQAARESMVLLKNHNDILPLKSVGSIAVIGPNAADLAAIEGTYNATPLHPVFPLDGIAAAFPKAKIFYSQGSPYVTNFPLPIPRTALHPSKGSTQQGLTAEYFANSKLSGLPVVKRIDKQIDFDWAAASPAPGIPLTDFGVRWTGTIQVPKPGDYPMLVNLVHCNPCYDREAFTIWLDGKQITSYATDQTREHRGNRTPIFYLNFPDIQPHVLHFEYTHHSNLMGAGVTLNWVPPDDAMREQAVKAAEQADAVIAIIGISPNLEGEEMPVNVPGFSGGDRTSINLPKVQQQLLQALSETHKPIIAVLMNGSALAIPWAQKHARAILEAWYPGEEGGRAIAETLNGKNNPGGKLPLTFYTSVAQLPAFTDYSMKNRTYRYFGGTPAYEFGYGLSYTAFRYDHVLASAKSVKAGDSLTVETDVENIGTVEGDAVVELYLTPPPNYINPLHELEGFQRIHLAPGQSQHLSFALGPGQLSLVDAAGKRNVQPGTYSVFVGGGQPVAHSDQTAGFTIHGTKALSE